MCVVEKCHRQMHMFELRAPLGISGHLEFSFEKYIKSYMIDSIFVLQLAMIAYWLIVSANSLEIEANKVPHQVTIMYNVEVHITKGNSVKLNIHTCAH